MSKKANLDFPEIESTVSLQAEKDRFYRQLSEISKMASLGNLSSGIAHEINNPLVAVKGFAQLIEMSADASPTVKAHAREIIQAAVRIQKITDHLRTFARESRSDEWAAFDLNEPIRRSLMLLEQQLNYRGIEVRLVLAEGLPDIWGVRNQLERTFHHLIGNSRDAFSAVRDEREKFIRITTELKDGFVRVSFEDNAVGMDEETRKRMFIPFFSTKDRAAGLGLSLIQKIAEEHHAAMNVTTRVAEGTTFSFDFPLATAKKAKAPAVQPIAVKATTTDKFRLLIVDDEPAAGEVLALYTKGEFEAQVFTDPRLATVALEKQQYDLILTDLNMPGLSGLEVLEKVRSCQAATPVIVISAYGGGDEEVEEAIARGAAGFLQKPFESPAEVRAFLKQTIEEARRKAA